jgi:aminopeptidase N
MHRTFFCILAMLLQSPLYYVTSAAAQTKTSAGQLIYSKGVFVRHMLRMMMFDARAGGDAKFIAMMHDFTATYGGKTPGTEEFEQIVSKHFGGDMDWFFKQWVYGAAIPKIDIEYRTVAEGGTGSLDVDVQMTGVPSDFHVQTPVLVQFEKGAVSGKINLTGSAMRQAVKPPAAPKSVEFNPLEAVLCELDVHKL